MQTFIIGLVILFVGAAIYGKFCEHVFGPDDRKTPAYTKQDGLDYVPMREWKNSLINLLNIAGTGPILGPIQGILFGPIAFITIPIGNVIGGAMHDYFSGMICLRDGGTQMPDMIRRYSNKGVYTFYQIFCSLLLLLVGAVFIYTPGDIAATQVFGFDGAATSVSTWVIYGVIFLYYLIATVFPIDKIIGRIYPIFGAILLFSAIGVFAGLFIKGYPLINIWDNWNGALVSYGDYFDANHFIPIFFITVACGILSGFHSTQTAIISRTMKSERQGRMTFYNMMILEGFIAMVWAAGAMGVYNLGLQEADANLATATIGIVCRNILGKRIAILIIEGEHISLCIDAEHLHLLVMGKGIIPFNDIEDDIGDERGPVLIVKGQDLGLDIDGLLRPEGFPDILDNRAEVLLVISVSGGAEGVADSQ